MMRFNLGEPSGRGSRGCQEGSFRMLSKAYLEPNLRVVGSGCWPIYVGMGRTLKMKLSARPASLMRPCIYLLRHK